MDAARSEYLNLSSAALEPGTTVLYRHRSGDSLATVTEATDEHVAFVGDDCDGHFPREQIDRMLGDGRLVLVLGER
ncbi:hypothetical protein ACFQDG_00725 [Natronoarchaeum mannanilyticum]|uniref:Uncharacterized protein n=1 Tax=Natronoarchaeum mannanilyticum TaxID=926360 RepID=A0AAV3TD91_9EURY